MKDKIKILICDDSATVRSILRQTFAMYEHFDVIGEAVNGKQAVEMALAKRPDLITMDIQMPEMDGLEATSEIMAYNPTPILIFSSALNTTETYTSFNAISLGALDVMEKPDVSQPEQMAKVAEKIVKKVELLSKIKVITHIKGKYLTAKKEAEAKIESEKEQQQKKRARSNLFRPYQLLAVGASTGGPAALLKILREFPMDFSLPICVVQHIADGFVEGLVEWMDREIEMKVRVAENETLLESGVVYFAPNQTEMLIENQRIYLTAKLAPWNEHRPSANYLFRSVAQDCRHNAIGLILTGMGNDGSEGLLEMRKMGAHTIAQDEPSSVVFGMPKAAIEKKAVSHVLGLDDIASHILHIIGEDNESDDIDS